jgi:hypothetical protein
MNQTMRDLAVLAVALAIYGFGISALKSEEQTRIYGPDGRSIGTATPQSDGSVRYRDAGGNSIGTSTTTPGGSAGPTTKFYDARGNVTGSTSSPALPGHRR